MIEKSKKFPKSEYLEKTFLNKRKLNIFTRSWMPEQGASVVLFLMHGYAEHSGRYTYFAQELVNAGYGVVTFDHQGHGNSEGKRADVLQFEDYVDDAQQCLDIYKERFPDKKWLLFGHSMGGAIATLLCHRIQQDVEVLLLSGPAFRIPDNVPKILKSMAKYVASVFPTLPTVALDVDGLSKDKQVVKHYLSDPLNYIGKVRARLGHELVEAGPKCMAIAPELTLPIWVGHGSADRVTDPEGSKAFVRAVKSKNVTAKYYSGFFHELLNEPEKDQVISDILFWLKKQNL